jgi:hypothetical protein
LPSKMLPVATLFYKLQIGGWLLFFRLNIYTRRAGTIAIWMKMGFSKRQHLKEYWCLTNCFWTGREETGLR